MTPEQEAALTADVDKIKQKLLTLEETFAKTHDPKAQEKIEELRGQILALTKRLEKAGGDKPAEPAKDPAATTAPAAPAAPAAPGGKKKSFFQKWNDQED